MKTAKQKKQAFIKEVKRVKKIADKNFFDKILQRATFVSG